MIIIMLTVISMLRIPNCIMTHIQRISPRHQTIYPHTQNIYHARIKLPYNEYIYITYERVGVSTYKIKMSGNINVNGRVYYQDGNNFALDDRTLGALHKYRRSLVVCWYDGCYDTIESDILLNIINHIKRILKYELFISL